MDGCLQRVAGWLGLFCCVSKPAVVMAAGEASTVNTLSLKMCLVVIFQLGKCYSFILHLDIAVNNSTLARFFFKEII